MKSNPTDGPGNDRAEPITIKFERTNVLTRWPCHVCGGETEKDQVLCEAEIRDDAELPDGTIRVCAECLAAGSIVERLQRTAKMYEDWAVMTRGLIGRLVVPSYEQWEEETMNADLDDYLHCDLHKTHEEIARMTVEEREALTSGKREEMMSKKRKWEAEWRKMEASAADAPF